jgi:hypothetical protein
VYVPAESPERDLTAFAALDEAGKRLRIALVNASFDRTIAVAVVTGKRLPARPVRAYALAPDGGTEIRTSTLDAPRDGTVACVLPASSVWLLEAAL